MLSREEGGRAAWLCLTPLFSPQGLPVSATELVLRASYLPAWAVSVS